MAPRLTVAVVFLALSTACGATHMVRLDTGQGAPLEYRPPSSNKSVQVDEDAFEEALTRLVLEEPLTLRPSHAGWLVRTASTRESSGPQWQHMVRKSFGGICTAGQPKEDCLSLLDDVMGLSEWDKLAVAVGLALDPMRQSIAEAVQGTLAPQLFYGLIGTGLVTWVFLAANPEPVFTKAAAIVSAVMLIYLGVDTFLEVVKASFELKRSTDRASTWEELEEASQRYGRVVGPRIARVLVLAVTVVVSRGMLGGNAWLASRLSMLPRFSEAATVGASQVGLQLGALEQVSAVAVIQGNLVISLAPTAVAMTAWNGGNGGDSASSSPTRSLEAVLRPGGRLIGEEGSGPQVRILKGSLPEAQKLFDALSAGGTPIQGSTYPGTLVRLPTGGTVGLRPVSTSGPPTIDVRIPGIGIREIKFTP